VTKFAEIESRRIARGAWDPTDPRHRTHPKAHEPNAAFQRTDYAVAKVYEAGKVVVVKGAVNLTSFEAEARAGRMRDAMSDDQVAAALAEGWNYQAVTVRGNQRKTRVQWFGK
jgi:hypothetical protein